jgi:predicted PurR-regulated permease PerM
MNSIKRKYIENRVFAGLLVLFTILFGVILQPFWGAIFWACAMAIIFYPLQRRMLRNFGGRSTLAASVTLLIGFIILILPAVAVIFAFIQEGTALYQRIEDEELDPALLFERIGNALPFLPELLQSIGVNTSSVREMLSESAVVVSQWLAQEAIKFGRNTFGFFIRLLLMLYLTFFLLRDGQKIVIWMRRAAPLGGERTQLLFDKFVEVTRATIKGNMVVAAVQGGLGGFIFWALGISAPVVWGVVMAILSLIPAVGAFVVWLPVAIYLYSTGDWGRATILVAFGSIVIGLSDNVLRPRLVGRDTKLPDYMVLFSTLGGLVLLGINGFVIGPLLAVLFVTFWNSFTTDLNNSGTE